jgi:hypothetical protein
MNRAVVALAFATLAMSGSACGYRTAVRPPEDTAPVIPGTAEAVRDNGAVVVRWHRAERSADGLRVDDLAAFVVERQRAGEESWERIAMVDVADQDRIRKRRNFSFRDTVAGPQPVSYRVLAVTAEGQEGPPTPAALATEPAATEPAEAATPPEPAGDSGVSR